MCNYKEKVKMKSTVLITCISVALLFSCNLERNRRLSDEEVNELKQAYDDSISLVLDSLYKVNIYVPPLYDKQAFDSTTTINFYELAKATQGELKLLINSKLITNEIIEIIKMHAQNNADLLFLIDKTGSMEDDLVNIKNGLGQVINALNEYQNIRLGISFYGDKNSDGVDWFSFRNFEMDYSDAKIFIQGIHVTGGNDFPESVYDGFFESSKLDFWKSGNKRMIILIGDAPPLEKPLSDYTLSDVIKKANESNIKMNFYPIVVTPSIVTSGKEIRTYKKEKIITTLYPNPSIGLINVQFERNDSYIIEVFNNSGEVIIKDDYTGDHWVKDFSSFDNGAYVLRAISKDKNFETSKFIVNK